MFRFCSFFLTFCFVFIFFVICFSFFFFFFFFQAEDGIRDGTVTGVQTCALPISCDSAGVILARCGRAARELRPRNHTRSGDGQALRRRRRSRARDRARSQRSEERRVGKECRSRWETDHGKKRTENTRRDIYESTK